MTRFLLAAFAALAFFPLTFGQEPPAAAVQEPPAAVVATASRIDPAAAVVNVRVAQFGGSGVCLAVSGGHTLVATNAHIVAEAPDAAVSVHKDGKEYPCARPVPCGGDDLVLLVATGELPCLDMADDEPREGEAVTLYGYPWDGQGQVVAKTGTVLKPDTEFRSTLAPVSGDSGGAVVNKDGKVVAINYGFEYRAGPNGQNIRLPQMGVRLKNLRRHVREKVSKLFPRLGGKKVPATPEPPKASVAAGGKPGECQSKYPAAPGIEYRQVQYYDRQGRLVTEVIPVRSGPAPGCPDGKCAPAPPAWAGGQPPLRSK